MTSLFTSARCSAWAIMLLGASPPFAQDIIPERQGQIVTEQVLLDHSHGSSIGSASIVGNGFIARSHRLLLTVSRPNSPDHLVSFDADSGKQSDLGEASYAILSPDGARVAFFAHVTPGSAELQIWIANSDGSGRRQITRVPGGLRVLHDEIAWSPDGHSLAYKFRVNIARDVPPAATAPSVVVTKRDTNPAEPQMTEIHILSLDTGADRLIFREKHPQVNGLVWSASTNSLITGIADMSAGGILNLAARIVAISVPDGHVETVISGYAHQASYDFSPAPDGSKIVIRSADPRFTAFSPSADRLAIVDLKTRKVALVEGGDAPDRIGMESAVRWNPDGRSFRFINNVGGVRDMRDVEGTSGHQIPGRSVAWSGDATIPVRSADGKRMAWLVTEHPSEKASLMTAAGDGRNAHTLAVIADPLAGYATGRMEWIKWKSPDGLELTGFVVYPLGFDPRKKYPLLVSIHGGPSVRWGPLTSLGPFLFDTPLEWHYWAARGYIVFQADYRQSMNYGVEQLFERRKNNDSVQRDFDDIMSGVDALIARGSVDSARMAVTGHSYGSYETNWIITHTHRFAAAVSYEGADAFFDWERGGTASSSFEWYTGERAPYEDLAAYTKGSAAFYLAGVTTPTLFINDENGVNSYALPWMHAALKRQGVDTELLFYRGEGHVVQRPENQRDLLERSTRWIDDHLGYVPVIK